MKKLTRLIALLLLLPMLASCDFVNQFLEDTTTDSSDDVDNQPSVQALPFTLIPHSLDKTNPRAMHAFITAVYSYQSLPLQEIPPIDYSTYKRVLQGEGLNDNYKFSYLGIMYTVPSQSVVGNEDLSSTWEALPIYCIEWSNRYHENCDCSLLWIKKEIGFPYVVYKYLIEGEIYYRYVVYDRFENGRWAYSERYSSHTCYEICHEIKSSTEVLEVVQVGDTMQELHQVTGVRLYDTTPLFFQSLTGEKYPPNDSAGKVKGRIDVLLADGMLRVDYKSEMIFGEFLKWRLSLHEGTSQKLDHLTISKMTFYPYGSKVPTLRGGFYVDYKLDNNTYSGSDYDNLVALPNGPVLP